MLDVRKRIAKYLSAPNSKVINNTKEALSYSRMSTVTACPHKHHLRYVKHYRSIKKSSNLFFGQCMHDTLAYFYLNQMKPTLPEVLDYWNQTVEGTFENTKEQEVEFKDDENVDTMRDYGALMLTGYYEYFAKKDRDNFEVLEVEMPFWIPLIYKNGRINNKYMLEGIIDLIVKDKDGNVIVIDHKTLGRKMNEDTPKTSQQLTMYFLGAIYEGHFVNKACFNNLYKTKTPYFERMYTERTNEDMLDFMQNAREISKNISYDANYKVNSYACGWCDMKDYCINNQKDSIYTTDHISLKERMHVND